MDSTVSALISSRPPCYDGECHQATWGKRYPLKGQGTLKFNLTRKTPFTISISPEKPAPGHNCPGYVALKIDEKDAKFTMAKPGQQSGKMLATTSQRNPGFVPDRITTYWFSFDRNNYVLKYGKGYTMEETTLLEHRCITASQSEDEKKKIREDLDFIFSPEIKKVVMLYDIVTYPKLKVLYTILSAESNFQNMGWMAVMKHLEQYNGENEPEFEVGNDQGNIEVEKKVDFYPFPLVTNLPPFVLDSSKATLENLGAKGANRRLLSASLPASCIELYSNVKNCDLDYAESSDHVKLSDAIRYSIETEGCILHEKIKEKKHESQFGKKNQVYLRVTLGLQDGQSPGIPYVLEIWPQGCGSPIHNHGNTFAVIHVLHGGLTIDIYNKDLTQHEHLKKFDVKKGDVTWISPNWYQAHKLWNSTSDYCATIQCYQYGDNDHLAWPYFDYLGTTSDIEEFLPDSDFDFLEMKKKVIEEYKRRP